jgi:prepilin-type N-terminal cleavage/methylation domain-containing protein
MKQKGFTLIELLVTITIVAILSAVAMVNFRTAIRKGNDAKMRSEVGQIRSALELYRSDVKQYPNSLPACGDPFTDPSGQNIYMESVPCMDDKTNPPTSYGYWVPFGLGPKLKYEVGAKLELETDCDCLNLNCNDYNYCGYDN